MKNRVVTVSLAIALVLSVGLVGCATEYGSELVKHTLTISSTNGGDNTCVPVEGCTCGEGTKSSGGLTVPEECICTQGTEVGIEATPDPGYRFAGWTGDVDTIADVNAVKTTIVMNGDCSVTANFIKQYDLTISSTAGGLVTTPGEGTDTYDEGKVINLVAQPENGYHFEDWTGDVDTIADVNATTTSITMNSDYTITANFAMDLYFWTDAYLALHGPPSLLPQLRNPCLVLGIMTNMVMDSVRVDLPDGRSVIIPAYTDVFSPDVDQATLLRFSSCAPGMPVAGGECVFAGLDATGEPIPGARNTDVWVGVAPPDPPTNIRAEVTDDGILVSWDQSPTIPGSFEPASDPQLGNQQLWIRDIRGGEALYGANGMSASSWLIARERANFTQGKDWGLSLGEMENGTYCLGACVHSIAPQGSLGKGCEYICSDPSQTIIFTIQDGEITIE